MNPTISRSSAPTRGGTPSLTCAHWLFAFMVMPLLALAAFAQGTALPWLSGIVHDPTGALVPGATVELARAQGAVLSSATTDGNGHFQFTQPAAGDYHLLITRPGFSPIDQPLHLTSSPQAPLSLTMALADVTTSVDIDAQNLDVIAPDNNHDAATVTADDMKNLPIFDDDIVATLSAFLDAGVTGEGGTTLMVDGVESTTVGVSPSAIERVSVNEDPYSAEFRQPGRGQVEITTKATAERFHGSASFTYRNSSMYASNYFSTTKPPEQRRIYEGYLTGPLKPLHDTAFLFSFMRKEKTAFSQVLATTIPEVMPAQNIASPTHNTQLSMKVSHQYNDHHSAYVLYTFEDDSVVNQSVGGLVQASAGYTSNDFDQHLTYHDDLTISPTILNQLNVHYERDYQSVIDDSDATPQVIVEGVATFNSAQQDAIYTENNPTVTDTVSWALVKHIPQQLKFGIQLPNLGRRVWEDHTNRQGTYTFSNAATYLSPTPTPASFSIQQGQDRFITLFAQPSAFFLDQIQLTKSLTVTPGLRYDFQNTLSNTKDGFLPRLSLAYLLDKKHALVVRTGAGFYIRRVGVNIGQQLARYQFAAERNLLLTSNICYPTCSDTYLATQPPSLFQYQPNLQAPQQAYFSLSVEGQVTKNSTVTLAYNGYRGWHALRSVDINAPLPPFTSAVRPNPNFAQILQLQSQGYQKTDGMSLSYRGRIGNIVSGFLQYTLQHADTNTQFSTFIPQNQYDPNNEWSRSDLDQRQHLAVFGTIYPDKPVTLGIGFYSNTPLPYTITTGTDDYKTGIFNARPAGVPRNSLNGGNSQDLQVRLGYTYKLHPKSKDNDSAVAFSLSSFNTFNKPNFLTYDGVVGSSLFMQPTTANDPRRLQLQGSYSF